MNDTIVLISCVKSKKTTSAVAGDLYMGPLFSGLKKMAIRSGLPWYILSAKHCVLSPGTIIEPYEMALNSLPISERRAWALKALNQLSLLEPDVKKIIIYAGQKYREFLCPMLGNSGITVEIPLIGKPLGMQLAWLKARNVETE